MNQQQPINLNTSQAEQPNRPVPLNANQVSKLSKLEQVNRITTTQQVYNLEYIFNKIKEIESLCVDANEIEILKQKPCLTILQKELEIIKMK